jgi:HK97 family phage major capsid protein
MDYEALKKSIEDVKDAIERRNKAFEDFKVENDTRLKEIEAKGHADPLLQDKVEKIAADIADLETVRQQLESIEKSVANMEAKGINGNGGESNAIYKSIGEQLKDVVTLGMPDASTSAKAEAMDRLNKVKAAASGANESIPSEGGFLVEKDSADMLGDQAIATGLLSQDCFEVPISSNSNGLKLKLMDETSRANGSRFGGIQVYWEGEADTTTATKPKFRQAEWQLKKLMGIMYATEELINDAPALTALVNRWFPMEFGFKVDDGIVNGTGAGMPLGIVNAGSTVSQAVRTGQGTRANNDNKVIYENIVDMYARLLNSSDPRAKWYINRALLPSIMLMSVPVGTGGAPVFLPPNGAAGQPYMTLLNKPIIPIEQCQAPGTAGDIILSDMNEYLLITKGGINAAASIHVRFLYDEMTFRWTYRLDGAPWRNSTLTPFKGGASATQGPNVVLAAS